MGGYQVTATLLADLGLWEVAIHGIGITQAEDAAEVEEMARDYLDCLDHVDADTARIDITWHPETETRQGLNVPPELPR